MAPYTAAQNAKILQFDQTREAARAAGTPVKSWEQIANEYNASESVKRTGGGLAHKARELGASSSRSAFRRVAVAHDPAECLQRRRPRPARSSPRTAPGARGAALVRRPSHLPLCARADLLSTADDWTTAQTKFVETTFVDGSGYLGMTNLQTAFNHKFQTSLTIDQFRTKLKGMGRDINGERAVVEEDTQEPVPDGDDSAFYTVSRMLSLTLVVRRPTLLLSSCRPTPRRKSTTTRTSATSRSSRAQGTRRGEGA